MRIRECEFANREGIKFSEEFGASMEAECPNCRANGPLGKKSCGTCGHDLRKPQNARGIDYTHRASRSHWTAAPSPENPRMSWLWYDSRIFKGEEVPIDVR